MKIGIKQKTLRELRISKGWTQEKLAEVSGVHARTIQRIENDGVASIQSLSSLARALDVEPIVLKDAETAELATDKSLSATNVNYSPTRASALRLKKRLGAENSNSWLLNEWVSWTILCLGGFLTVSVLLMTQANLSRVIIFNVLLPGSTIGTLLMLIGGLGVQFCKKTRDKALLAKLFGNGNDTEYS